MKISKIGKSKLMKTVAAAGTVTAILTVAATVFSGYYFVKLFRYIDTAQRVFPEIGKAARLYCKNNAATETEAQNDPNQEPQKTDSE